MPKDILDDVLDENESDDSQETSDDTTDDSTPKDESGEDQINVADLQKEIFDLKKQNKGYYKEMKAERAKRQEFQDFKGRFEQLSSTVNDILTKTKDKDDSSDDGETKINGIPVSFDDDGNPYISQEEINSLVKGYTSEIDEVRQTLQQSSQQKQMEDAFNSAVDSVVSQDNRFAPARSKLDKARAFLNEKLIEYQKINNVPGQLTPGQAIDILSEEEDIMEDFTEEFPGFDASTALRAYDSKTDLRTALDGIAKLDASDKGEEKTEKEEPTGIKGDKEKSDALKKLLKKPSTHGSTSDKKASQVDVVERVSQVSTEDLIDNLSDDDVAKLESALLKEEMREEE